MAAEIAEVPEITEGNQGETLAECLRILLRVEAVLNRFAPLLDQAATSPLATRRAMRKAAGR